MESSVGRPDVRSIHAGLPIPQTESSGNNDAILISFEIHNILSLGNIVYFKLGYTI